MIPIKDHNPSKRFPLITYLIITICSLVWLYEFSLGPELFNFFETWALQPGEVTAGESYITVITSMFLHGGWMHVIGNMVLLNIFGDNLECRMGHMTFLGFYIICGLAASALQIFTDPHSMIPNIGASGCIAGVMGAYLLLFPKAKVDTLMIGGGIGIRKITMPAFMMLGYWFVIQVFSGTLTFGHDGGGVAYWAHVGGFLAGLVLAVFFKGKKPVQSR